MILAGELAAGAKLNEVAIAELLGVSRGPVREAFRALEESGLVRLEKNRGVFVRQIAVEEADEIYELRAVLDEFVGRRVAQNAAAADMKALRGAGRAHGPRRDAQRPRRLSRGEPRVPRHARRARRQRASSSQCTAGSSTSFTCTAVRRWRKRARCRCRPREHHDILDKIAAGQAAAAGRALFDHVMGSRERMHRAGRRPPRARQRSDEDDRRVNGRTLPLARRGRSWSCASTAASPTTSTRRSRPAARRSWPR